MTIRLAAASVSIAAVTMPGASAAETATTRRSTFSGSAATSGTQRQPSIESTPGFTTRTRSGSKPSRSRLRRMIRPGFIFDETPTIAIVAGSSRRRIWAIGRSGRISRRPGARASPRTSSATRPSGVMASGLISSSTSSSGRQMGARANSRSTTSTSRPIASRGGWPRKRRGRELDTDGRGEPVGEIAGRCDRRRDDRDARAGSEVAGDRLGVRATGADRHDRTEVIGPAQRGQELAADARLVLDERRDRVPDRAGRPAGRPSRGPRRRPRSRSCGTTTTPPRSVLCAISGAATLTTSRASREARRGPGSRGLRGVADEPVRRQPGCRRGAGARSPRARAAPRDPPLGRRR